MHAIKALSTSACRIVSLLVMHIPPTALQGGLHSFGAGRRAVVAKGSSLVAGCSTVD